MPNNFMHVGLIRLILPRAKVIDARRHPMDCCVSGFKQLFGEGQDFSYGLDSIGRYYRDYVELMDHWDDVLPGFVLRVQHEQVPAHARVGLGRTRRLPRDGPVRHQTGVQAELLFRDRPLEPARLWGHILERGRVSPRSDCLSCTSSGEFCGLGNTNSRRCSICCSCSARCASYRQWWTA